MTPRVGNAFDRCNLKCVPDSCHLAQLAHCCVSALVSLQKKKSGEALTDACLQTPVFFPEFTWFRRHLGASSDRRMSLFKIMQPSVCYGRHEDTIRGAISQERVLPARLGWEFLPASDWLGYVTWERRPLQNAAASLLCFKRFQKLEKKKPRRFEEFLCDTPRPIRRALGFPLPTG